MTNLWSAPVSAAEAARRANGRRRYNALRTFQAAMRRREVAHLYWHLPGGASTPGRQRRVAEALGVSESVISRDLAILRTDGWGSLEPCGHAKTKDWSIFDDDSEVAAVRHTPLSPKDRRGIVGDLLEGMGLRHGTKARIAELIGCSQATICRDVDLLMADSHLCHTCGHVELAGWSDP